MSLALLSGIAAVVTAVATIITLLFVGFELRATRKQAKLAMLTTLDQAWNAINAQIAQSPELSALLTKGTYKPEALTQDEATQYFFLIVQFMNNHRSVWTLISQEGLNTHHELWLKCDISVWYNTPGWWRIYQAIRPIMPLDYDRFVDEQVKTRMELRDWRQPDAQGDGENSGGNISPVPETPIS